MITIQQKIAEKFLAELADQKSVTPEQIKRLRLLLASGKKIKPDEFAKAFSEPPGENVA